MNGHMVLLGGSGSGKTQTMKAMISEISKYDIPMLIFDFNDDYFEDERDLNFVPDNNLESYDVLDGLPINPLALNSQSNSGNRLGVDMTRNIYKLNEIFKNIFDLGDQQAVFLMNAMYDVYRSKGITTRTQTMGDNGIMPEFRDLENIIVDHDLLYNRLRGIFDLGLFDNNDFSLDTFLQGKNVLRFTECPTDMIKEVTAEIMLDSIYSYLLRMGHYNGLRLAIFIDEAHKIANFKSVKKLFKEARKYGCAVFLCSQEAKDFNESIYSNAGTIISMQLQETSNSKKAAEMLVQSNRRDHMANIIRTLPKYYGIIKNVQYTPSVTLRIKPYHERVS